MKNEEKVPYLKTLMYIALADDMVEESEIVYFTKMGELFGLSEKEVEELQNSVAAKQESIADITKGITERSTKLLLLYDLLALCYVDNNYSLAEQNGMKDICALLGIENTKLEEMEAVMEENLELQKKINMVLER